MKKTLKLFTALVLVLCMLCACGAETAPTQAVALTEDEKALLEAVQEDINVIDPDDFSETVSGLSKAVTGQIYQLTGYFQPAAEGAENPSLGDAKTNPKVAIELRYLIKELTAGDRYTIVGIVTVEEHDGHSHITFDALTVESYVGK